MGLGGHVAIPEMLGLLGHVVPGAFNSFFWLNEVGEVTDAVLPFLIPSAMEALATLPGDEPSFPRIAGAGKTVGGMRDLHAAKDYSRTILVNEVWRPYGIGCGLDLVLREGGRARAILFIDREPRQARFHAAEYRTLADVAPYFLHAMTSAASAEAAIDPTEHRSAVLIVASDGTVLSASDEAMHLLLLMTGQNVVRSIGWRSMPPAATALITELIRRQANARAGRPGLPASMERTTRWGHYRVRGFPQRRPDGSSCDDLVVRISEHLPTAIRLSRRIARLELSPREREVVLLIAKGGRPETAAVSLGISTATWRSYVKRIYQRLGVSSRDGLHALLHGIDDGLSSSAS